MYVITREQKLWSLSKASGLQALHICSFVRLTDFYEGTIISRTVGKHSWLPLPTSTFSRRDPSLTFIKTFSLQIPVYKNTNANISRHTPDSQMERTPQNIRRIRCHTKGSRSNIDERFLHYY